VEDAHTLCLKTLDPWAGGAYNGACAFAHVGEKPPELLISSEGCHDRKEMADEGVYGGDHDLVGTAGGA
jgi:hypothetical protein